MQKYITFFKAQAYAHRLAILCAVLTTLLVALPQIFFRIDQRELYTPGVPAIEMLPDSPWSARVREIQDGHGFSSFYFKEGKEDPYLFQPLGSMVVAYTGQIFNLDINNTILLSRILYPSLAFLLVYAFVFLLLRDKQVAVTTTACTLIINELVTPGEIKALLQGKLLEGVPILSFLEITRPVNSVMIFIFLFAALAALWRFFERRTLRWGIIASVLIGLNFYNYFYSSTFLYAFGLLFAAFLLIERDWKALRDIAYVYLGALIVGLPWIYNLYQATLHENYLQVAQRHGVVPVYDPEFIGITALTAIIVFILAFPRKNLHRFYFTFALALSPFITLNQQILTGRELQPGHYHWYMHKPIAMMVVLFVCFYYLNKLPQAARWRRMFTFLILAVNFAIGFAIQGVAYYNDREARDGGYVAIERQKYAPVMHWLNEHAQKDEVVYAEEMLSHIVVIYTPLNVFQHRSDQLMLSASNQRMEDIIFTRYRLRGVDSDTVRQVFEDERGFISTRKFGVLYRDHERGGNYDNIPDEVLNGIIATYEEELHTPTEVWLEQMWRKYDVRYVLWDKIEKPEWKLDRFKFLEEKATFGDIGIYELRDPVN